MGMLGSLILLLLGAQASTQLIAKYRPGLKFWLDLLIPFQGHLGVGAALYGLYVTIRMVAYLGFIRYAPMVYIMGLCAGVVSMGLGTIYGFETARMFIEGRLSARQMSFLSGLHKRLSHYKSPLGYAGLVLGGFGVLINVFV